VPSILAIYDYWHKQRRGSSADNLANGNGHSVVARSALFGRGKYLVPAAFCLSFANAFQWFTLVAPRSTYICPLSSLSRENTLLVQLLAVLIDCYILFSSHTIFNASGLVGAAEDETALATLGHIFLVSSITGNEIQNI